MDGDAAVLTQHCNKAQMFRRKCQRLRITRKPTPLKSHATTLKKVLANRLILAVTQLSAVCAAATFGSAAVPLARADVAPGANPGGNISGTLFQDFNANGVMNTTNDASNPAIDAGVAGVLVQA